MPTGVRTVIGAAAGGGSGDGTLAAQLFLTGTSERGDTSRPVVARSYSEFTDLVGPRTLSGAAHDAVRAYFAESEGFGRVVFARVLGPGATSSASVTLKDRSGGAGLDTLVVAAASPGPWGAGLSVVVTDGVVANTFDLSVVYQGQTVESFRGLASPAAAAAAAATSTWVRITNSGSATAAPGNNPKTGTFALTGGADDLANVGTAQLTAALDRFTSDYGPGLVAIPGQVASSVAAAIAAHCAASGRVGVVSPAAGTSATSAASAARSLRSTTNARTLRLVHPWVWLPADGEAAARLVSPEGFYAGRRAAAIGRVGPWQPPATAELGTARYVTAPEYAMTTAQRDALVDDAVVPIVGTPATRIYGDRSLDPGEQTWRFGAYSDLVAVIAWDCSQALDPMVGRAIDGLRGTFFTEVLSRLVTVLERYASAGGLAAGVDDAGELTDPGWQVDLAANTGATVAAGQVIADVSVRPPGIAELITVRITKTGFTG